MKKTIFVSFVIFLLLQSKSYAYIDPGTGGLIIQAILGALAAVGIFYRNLKDKIKKLLFSKNKEKNK